MIIFRCVRTSRHVYTMFDSTFTLLLCSIKMIMNDSTWLNWLKMVEKGFTMVVYSYLAISAPCSLPLGICANDIVKVGIINQMKKRGFA